MEFELSALDIKFLVNEFRDFLENGFVRKIYQHENKPEYEFLFEIFKSGKGSFWLRIDKNKIFITQYKKSGIQPSNFCLFLRKYLENKKIISINQYDFERVVEMKIGEFLLIVELFSDGNLILCDQDYNIIRPLYSQEWKDRVIKPKLKYSYPPKKADPYDFENLKRSLASSDKKILAFLATAGFGPYYAKYICEKANVNENHICNNLDSEKISKIYETIKSFEKMKLNPCVYENFVSAFPIEKEPKKFTKTFSEAIDELFYEKMGEAEDHEIFEKLKRIEDVRKKAIEKWSEVEKEARETAEILYRNYNIIESILEGIKKAREKNINWLEIKERIKNSEYSKIIKEINENKGEILLDLDNKIVKIDLRKSVYENAEKYFEKAKNAKRKLERVYESIEKQKIHHKQKPLILVKSKRKWYEKFRWFFTSDGFLVIGGKDAETNEEIIKKYVEPDDLVFHADIKGASFVVIKSEGKKITDVAKKEASEFAAAYSKAWVDGLGTVDVYCVKPEQVSKKPPSGEYLSKGAFMIYGERDWYRNVEVKISIGVKIEKDKNIINVIAGPDSAVKTYAKYFVTIKPGDKKSSDLAKMIKKIIIEKSSYDEKPLVEKIQIDDIQKWIHGTGELV